MAVTITYNHPPRGKVKFVEVVGTTETSYHVNLKSGKIWCAIAENITTASNGAKQDVNAWTSGWLRFSGITAADRIVAIAMTTG